MRYLTLTFTLWSLLIYCALPAARAATWLTDMGAAKLKVAAENKPMLVLFTGSDWCPACQRLKREVFTKPEFSTYADVNLILVEADFPRYRTQTPTLKQANAGLAKSFGIQYYPTMILLDTRGQEVARLRYGNDGVGPFLASLDAAVHNVAGARSGNRGIASNGAPASKEPPADVPMFNGAAPAPPPVYSDFVLKNISGSSNRRFALINNQTLTTGETARVKLADREVKVRCVQIRDRSVVIAIEGQPGERELRLAAN